MGDISLKREIKTQITVFARLSEVEREYLKTFLPFQQMNFTEDMKKAFAQKNLDDFYDRYLSARISQIRGLVKNLNSFTKAKELKPFYKQLLRILKKKKLSIQKINP